jgi:hypothetical protein
LRQTSTVFAPAGLLLVQNPDDLLFRELLSKQATEGQNRPIKKAANPSRLV